MQLHPTSLFSYSPNSTPKSLSDLDFFGLLEEPDLPPIERKRREDAIERIALLHFINSDLPFLLNPQDLNNLDTLSQDQSDINLDQLKNYLREKISNFEALLDKTAAKYDITVEHQIKVPIGSGFGTSAG